MGSTVILQEGEDDMTAVLSAIIDTGALPGGTGPKDHPVFEVFVHGLSTQCTDLHLYQLMSPFGQIGPRGCSVVENKNDGTCVGYGFVNFLAEESAKLAIETLNGCVLPGGKKLKVE